jgi:hypothetical protein
VQQRPLLSEPVEVATDLHQAADVAACQDLGAGGEEGARLLLAEPRRDLRVLEVVDPRRAAAQLPVGRLDEGGADCGEEAAWGGPLALSVRQVAGVVVGDDGTRLEPRPPHTEPVEERGDVAHARGKAARPLLLGAAGEQLRIGAHAGAAARRGAQDRVDVVGEGGEIAAGERERQVVLAGMQGEGAAAPLTRGHHDLDTVVGEDLYRRLEDRRPEHLLHAAGEERDPRLPSPARRHGGESTAPGASRRRQASRHELEGGSQARRQQRAQRPEPPPPDRGEPEAPGRGEGAQQDSANEAIRE